MEAPSSDGYMFALIDRGADALLASGRITLEVSNALKAEARRRLDALEFFGAHRLRKPHRAEVGVGSRPALPALHFSSSTALKSEPALSSKVYVFALTAALNPTLLAATTVMFVLPSPSDCCSVIARRVDIRASRWAC